MQCEIVVEAEKRLIETMLEGFVAASRAAVAARRRFSVAIPGGSVAEVFFPALAHAGLDWRHTHVFWVDERCVPAAHDESNYGRARVLWLDPAGPPPQQLHPMAGEAPDLDAAAAAAARELVDVLGDPPRVDLALLGVGLDGHVASLFPGYPALLERSRYVLGVPDAPKPPPRRLTWTLPALAGARALWVVALGAAKAAPLRAALVSKRTAAAETAATSPLARAVHSGPPVRVFVDREAGSGLL